MPFGVGRQAFNLTETEIRYAISNTKSNHGAARFLRVTYTTYRKYASLYIDSASGKSLFELHKNICGKGIQKRQPNNNRHMQSVQNIIDGKRPNIRLHDFKAKLIRYGFKEEKCDCCGFEERRAIDYSVPLLIDFIDDNKTNFALENIRFLCYNCTYLLVRNPYSKTKKFSL